ncbi:sorbitol dehydrogenase [Heyndrickxia sporothermodurans]|nr:sorbitol dehydrogenase [Heyndrickxia sporothermodurans]
MENVSEPSIGVNEIKIKVHGAGICGTDIHIIQDEYPYDAPVIMGHEYSGIVVEAGIGVEDFLPRDRVVSLTAISTCGTCSYCRQGLLMLCNERKSIGSGVNGAFAEYIVVPAAAAYKIPARVSMDAAVLTEPLACVVRCVMERGQVNAGDLVIISGPGTIGMLALQVAKANGGNVVVTGTAKDKDRLKLALELGAYAVINFEEEGSYEKLMSLTNNKGFDVAIECAGVEASLNSCIQLLRKQGTHIQMGLFGKKVEFDSDLALMKEIHFINGYATEPTSWEIALRLLEFNHVKVEKLISNKVSIYHWEKALELAINKVGYKTIIIPSLNEV